MQSQNSKESKHVRVRQPYKGRYPPEFLCNLPEGVTYNDPEKQTNKLSDKGLSIFNDNDGDIVVVADFTINIDKITKQQLISMRKFLPSEEYRLIKNRKSARLCRKKRKEERGDMQNQIDELMKTNAYLRSKLETTERLLQESERQLIQYMSNNPPGSGFSSSNPTASGSSKVESTFNAPFKQQARVQPDTAETFAINQLLDNIRRGSVAPYTL